MIGIIAVDYGRSKCGYAIGTVFVLESGTVRRDKLDELIEPHDEVILGLPLSMSGNYSTQTFEVISYGLKLLKRGKKVKFVDERLTSRLAKIFGKSDDDRFSAEALLLEFIQNKSVARDLVERTVCEPCLTMFVTCKKCGIIEVPPPRRRCCSGIGYTRDPFIAYSQHKSGLFVYRVWEDFVGALLDLKQKGELECIFTNDAFAGQIDALEPGVPVYRCDVVPNQVIISDLGSNS